MLPLSALLIVNMAASLFQTSYMELYLDTEKPSYKADLPLLLIFIALVFIAFCAFYFKKHNITKETAAAFEKAALIFSGAICLFIIFFFRVGVASDGMAISNVATDFLKGNYSAFTANNYLFRYSHQLSMVAFEELVYYIFGAGNYIVLQFINLFSIVSIVWSFHRITEELFNNYEVSVILSVLCMGMLPLYLYVTYIYGDIPGMGLAMPAVYFVMKYLRTYQSRLLVAAFFCMTGAILLKSNNFVLLAAVVIIMLLRLVKGCGEKVTAEDIGINEGVGINKDVSINESLGGNGNNTKNWIKINIISIIFILALISGPTICSSLIDAGYAKAAGLEKIPDGVPKIAWVAMGLQENDYIENGWFNGYNCRIYEECGFDTDKTAAACMESIKESVSLFAASPGHGLKFFYKKFISQWNAPDFQSQINIEWNSRHSGSLSAPALYFIYGGGRTILEWLMNIYHFMILLGAVACLLCSLRKRSQSFALLALCIFGGYFFHMFWEAKSRYGLQYYLMYIPFAAYGLWRITGYAMQGRSYKKGAKKG